MGTCTNNKNKLQLEYIHQILASDIPRNLPPDYTELKGIPLQCGTIINDFILFQLKRKKIKQQLKRIPLCQWKMENIIKYSFIVKVGMERQEERLFMSLFQ